MKYIKTFESFSDEKKPTILVVHMHSKISDDVAFNLIDMARVIEVDWNDPEIENIFDKNLPDIRAIVLTGASEDPREYLSPEIPEKIHKSGLPTLGICYGYQWWMMKEGAKIDEIKSKERVFTFANIADVGLFRGLEKRIAVYVSHREIVRNLPTGYEKIAETDKVEFAGAQNLDKKFWGLQFHPEYNWVHDVIFKNFLRINNL